MIAKYRCDEGDKGFASSAEFRFPGVTGTFTIRADADHPIEDYCGPDDPGDEIDVSPVSPNMETAVGQPPLPTPPASSLAPS